MAIIEVDGLRKSYGGRPVVDGVSFTVGEGEIFGMLGPNGAGKPTNGLGRLRFGNDRRGLWGASHLGD